MSSASGVPGADLGFLENIDASWRIWDGPKAGGRPVRGAHTLPEPASSPPQVWLRPDRTPPLVSLTCAECGQPLTFIIQVRTTVRRVEPRAERDSRPRSTRPWTSLRTPSTAASTSSCASLPAASHAMGAYAPLRRRMRLYASPLPRSQSHRPPRAACPAQRVSSLRRR